MSSRSMNMTCDRLVASSFPPSQFFACFVNLTAGDDERVIDQRPPVNLGIKYLVTQHHRDLIQYLADVA
jgi:hypothetical protein